MEGPTLLLPATGPDGRVDLVFALVFALGLRLLVFSGIVIDGSEAAS